jgi:hypothetical protein
VVRVANLVPGIIGLTLFVLFAGFLAIKIAEVPLGLIILLVILAAVGDFVLQAKRGEL